MSAAHQHLRVDQRSANNQPHGVFFLSDSLSVTAIFNSFHISRQNSAATQVRSTFCTQFGRTQLANKSLAHSEAAASPLTPPPPNQSRFKTPFRLSPWLLVLSAKRLAAGPRAAAGLFLRGRPDRHQLGAPLLCLLHLLGGPGRFAGEAVDTHNPQPSPPPPCPLQACVCV